MDGKMKPRAHQQAISGMGGKLQPHENRNDFWSEKSTINGIGKLFDMMETSQ